MKLKREFWQKAVAFALTTAILATSTAPAAAQLPERTCANAVTLFPDNNPEPGSLTLIPVPEPTNLNT